MEKVKVLIIDNSVLARRILSDAVNATEFACAEQTASTGAIALERLRQRRFDIVLLSISLTGEDGLEILSTLHKQFPDVDVLVTGTKDELSDLGSKAKSLGASGLIDKPPLVRLESNSEDLTRQFSLAFSHLNATKYKAAFRVGGEPIDNSGIYSADNLAVKGPVPASPGEIRKVKKQFNGADLVVIASSTGGPLALEKTCIPLAPDFDCPVLVVQHMPADFTRIMAASLDSRANLKVLEGSDGSIIRSGEVVIAPGGVHMTVKTFDGVGRLKMIHTPTVNGVRPAADVLFSSVAQNYRGAKVLAVILTGMGNDGARGVRELKEACNCYCLVQSEKTCVVYGMPRSVYEAGLADEVVDIDDMAARIQQIVLGRG